MAGLILELTEWLLLTVSIINTILQFYLALMIALNAERRSWGLWLSSGGLFVGALFFVSHTAILGRGPSVFDDLSNFWWYLGLVAALVLPYVWYVAVLWYAGLWDKPNLLGRRHQVLFAVSTALSMLVIVVFLTANPFPSYAQVIRLQLTPTPVLLGVPVLVVVFTLDTMLNIGFALHALHTLDNVSARSSIGGNTARRRARPWMQRTTFMLMIVALLVAGVMAWVVTGASQLVLVEPLNRVDFLISSLDLIISICIMLAVIFLGQAITRYEVFTGKLVPRRRLASHWRGMLTLSIGLGVLMSAALQWELHPVYVVVGVCLLTVCIYTAMSQASHYERSTYLAYLRPVVQFGTLYDRLLAAAPSADADTQNLFATLCSQVLGARAGYLLPLGSMGSLVGSPLTFPVGLTAPDVHESLIGSATPETLCVPLDPQTHAGACWAIPLWSERGLIGLLLLSDKANGELFTHEEIDIARGSTERLIDMKASTEITRRLIHLQRQHMVNSTLTDHRTRRVLHDDILPQLHTAMLTLSGSTDSTDRTIESLIDVHHRIADLLHELPVRSAFDLSGGGLVSNLKTLIDSEFRSAFDCVNWQVDTFDDSRPLPAQIADVLYHACREAIRNAARHARTATRDLNLTITIRQSKQLVIAIADNGVGIQVAKSGGTGGHGLLLHSTMLAIIGGTLTVDSTPDAGTTVTLAAPGTILDV